MSNSKLVIQPDQIPLFLRAIAHNKKTIVEQISTRRLCSSDFYFIKEINGTLTLAPPGSHSMDASRTLNDYVAGALVGALPFLDLHGSDGVKIDECGTITEIELKLAMKTSSRYFITDSGCISVVNNLKVLGFRSDVAAHYEIVHNIDKKNVPTYLVVFDSDLWEIITIRKMEGSKVIELIGKNQLTGEDKTSKKRSITLSAFIKHGKPIYLDFLDIIGVDEWEDRIYARDNKTRSNCMDFWNETSVAQLKRLWIVERKTAQQICDIMNAASHKAVQSKITRLGIQKSKIDS